MKILVKSLDEAYEDLFKTSKGEGSRGGKVVGHTKSGKPIYDKHHSSYSKFSSVDHKDAAKLHKKRYEKGELDSYSGWQWHQIQSEKN